MKDNHLLRLADGEVSTHADLSGVYGRHLDDMVVDASDRDFGAGLP